MKLILIPLIVMVLLSAVSMAGLAQTSNDLSGDFTYNYGLEFAGFGNQTGTIYDESGHGVLDYQLNPLGETGSIVPYERAIRSSTGTLATWRNETGDYWLFTDAAIQDDLTALRMSQIVNVNPSGSDNYGYGQNSFNLASAVGWIALLGVIMALGSIAGLKIFGSGESEVSVSLLLKGSFYITIWTVLSVAGYDLLFNSGQFLLFILYSFLTLMFAIGVINSVGGPQSE